MGTIVTPPPSGDDLSVHPHGRGDNEERYGQNQQEDGSPPRAWGQFVRGSAGVGVMRFTPTGVGTIPPPSPAASGTAVHPHGRGDNFGAREVQMPRNGSPPRAWGQSIVQVAAQGLDRFTPTGVGTMLISAGRDIARAVHPHGRGDNNLPDSVKTTKGGSPPRAWGQCRRRRGTLRRVRFTPTGVGTILASQAF